MKIKITQLNKLIEIYLSSGSRFILKEEAPPFSGPEKNNDFRKWIEKNISKEDVELAIKDYGIDDDTQLHSGEKSTKYSPQWYGVWDKYGEEYLSDTRTWGEYAFQTADELVGDTGNNIPASTLPKEMEKQRRYIAGKWRAFSGISEGEKSYFLLMSEKSNIGALVKGSNFSVPVIFPIMTGVQARATLDDINNTSNRVGMTAWIQENMSEEQYEISIGDDKVKAKAVTDKLEVKYFKHIKEIVASESPDLQRFTQTGRFQITSFRKGGKKEELKSTTYGPGIFNMSRGQSWLSNLLGYTRDQQKIHGTSSKGRTKTLNSAYRQMKKNEKKSQSILADSTMKKLEESSGCINIRDADLEKLMALIGDGNSTQVYIIPEAGDLIYAGILPEFYDVLNSVSVTVQASWDIISATTKNMLSYYQKQVEDLF